MFIFQMICLAASIVFTILTVRSSLAIRRSKRRIEEANAQTMRSLAEINATVAEINAIRAARDLRDL